MFIGFGAIIFVILALAVLDIRKKHRRDAQSGA